MGALTRDDVQRAYNAAITGDLDPLVGMFGPSLEWRGIERGHWLWRSAPS